LAKGRELDAQPSGFGRPKRSTAGVRPVGPRPACGGAGRRFWLFYGALSNVEYTLTVTDTATGAVRTYHNPGGTFASVADVSAF
jgi:hypothetical protein